MIRPVMLWVDLTQGKRNCGLPTSSSAPCRICHIFSAQSLRETSRSAQPRALCFEFDYPPSAGLTVLSETKRSHPPIPIVMLAEPRSESLAVWALRTRVWDYLIKPVCEAEIMRSIMPLFMEEGYNDWDRRAPRNFITPKHDIPAKPTRLKLSRAERAILTANAYIEAHLTEKISEQTVAKFCGLSTSCFSRKFKHINGLNFSRFVLQVRVEKAIELLENKHAKVTEVCYAAGFKNLSHFSLTFRSCVGVSPTSYRARLRRQYIDAVSGGTSGTFRSYALVPLAFVPQMFDLAHAVI